MTRSHDDTESPTLSEPLRFAAWAPRRDSNPEGLRALVVGPGASALAVFTGGRRVVAAEVGALLDALRLGDVRQLARRGWYWGEERAGGVATAEYSVRAGRGKQPWELLLSDGVLTVRQGARVVTCGRWADGHVQVLTGETPPDHALEGAAGLARWLTDGAAAFD